MYMFVNIGLFKCSGERSESEDELDDASWHPELQASPQSPINSGHHKNVLHLRKAAEIGIAIILLQNLSWILVFQIDSLSRLCVP